MKRLEGYKRPLLLGAIFIALGIIITNTLKDTTRSLGIVFVAVGGLFIIGMSKKQKEK